MRKIILLPAMVFTTLLFAQDSVKSNIIKSNITGYALRNFNLTYERVITKKISVSAGFGVIANGSIPFASQLSDANLNTSSAQIKGSNFTIEPRIYLGKGYGKGFYLAPYFRYSSFDLREIYYNLHVSYAGIGKDIPVDFAGKVKGASGGLMLGSQWFLGAKKNWVIDAWFIGGHYGKGTGTVTGTTKETLSPEMQSELKKQLNGLDIPFVKYETKVNAHGAEILVDGPWAGLRSGLSLGYRF
ncbi:DUF3575 domain-containing protein [Kaistella sp.]|uniref:DUF3575 domain-containing protein n=1 Tax=Kaistella sp. TaxID=2782235 RepID=UPI003C5737B9